MAVELAKVSLWLHTFTVGAPLSFLDHHLRTGDSLFGFWLNDAIKKTEEKAGPLFPREALKDAQDAADPMKFIEQLTDADLDEAKKSSSMFFEVNDKTDSLNTYLSVLYALEWLNPKGNDKAAVASYLTGFFGNDLIEIAKNSDSITKNREKAKDIISVLERARPIVKRERFLHWQVAFPGVWPDWENKEEGGFDVVVGNPPWERIKLQQVEWFEARDREIASKQRASEREPMVEALIRSNSPLAKDFEARPSACGIFKTDGKKLRKLSNAV